MEYIVISTIPFFKNLLDQNNLFTTFTPSSEISEIITEGIHLLSFAPDILNRIKADQDAYAKKKRLTD